MSTSYRFSGNVSFEKDDLLEKLAKYRIFPVTDAENATDVAFPLRDPDGQHLWVYFSQGEDGSLTTNDFERFGGNDPHNILGTIFDIYGYDYLSEHDDGFDEECEE